MHIQFSPLSVFPHQRVKFVVVDECTLTHHSHPKSIVYIMFHSWFCTFCVQVCTNTQWHVSIIVSYRIFSPLQKSFVLCLFIYPSLLITSSLFTVSSFVEYHVLGIVVFSDWLLLLSNVHLKFIHVFSWLDSAFI